MCHSERCEESLALLTALPVWPRDGSTAPHVLRALLRSSLRADRTEIASFLAMTVEQLQFLRNSQLGAARP
jgi:hypothetical protein